MFFVAAELVAIGGFILGFAHNQPALAVMSLFLPLHLVVVGALFRSNFLLLAFFSFIFPLSGIELLPHPYREAGLLVGILGLLALLVGTERLLDETKAPRGPGRTVGVLLIIVAVTALVANALALLRGYGPRPEHLVVFLMVLLAAWVYAVTPESQKQVRWLTLTIVVVYAASFLLLPVLLGSSGGFATRKTFDSLFGRPNLNLVGMIATACAAILLGTILDARGWRRFLQLLAAAVVLAVLLYSKSRGAWLGFGLAFLYVLVRAKSLKLAIVAAVLVAALLSLDVFRFALQVRAEQTSTDDPALLGRLIIWRTAWIAFSRNWLFGIGVENFRYLKFGFGFPSLMDPKYWHGTHNLFVEQYVSLGVVGGTAFLLLPVIAFWRVDRIVRDIRSGLPRGLVIGINAGLLAYASHCLLDSPGWHTSTFVLWGILLGLAFSTSRVSGGSSTVDRRLGAADGT